MTQNVLKYKTHCKIKWDGLSECAFHKHFAAIEQANLLQSLDYVRVMARLNHQRIRRGLIVINGQDAGIFQILEAGILKNSVHGVILDRGPLWLDGFGSADDFEAFMRVFSEEFPKRFGRRVRIMPEIENSPEVRQSLESRGFKNMSPQGYQTIWVDLRSDLDVIRANLKGRWRGSLRKAEKTGIEVHWSDEGKYFSWLMSQYMRDKTQRKYDGVSQKTMIALAGEFSRGKNMLIGTALLDGAPIASILLLNHGASATYQIGYSSEKGRNCCAHHLLLWRAVGVLQERQIYDFDLGGVKNESAQGVKTFKEGLGGKLFETPGLYCR